MFLRKDVKFGKATRFSGNIYIQFCEVWSYIFLIHIGYRKQIRDYDSRIFAWFKDLTTFFKVEDNYKFLHNGDFLVKTLQYPSILIHKVWKSCHFVTYSDEISATIVLKIQVFSKIVSNSWLKICINSNSYCYTINMYVSLPKNILISSQSNNVDVSNNNETGESWTT